MPKNYQYKYETTKKVEESLAKFDYYLEEVFPTLFKSSSQASLSSSSSSFQSVRGTKDLLYFYGSQQVEGQFVFNQHAILETAKKIYLGTSTFENQITKINDKSFQRVSEVKATFLPLSRVVKEIMTFHVPKKSCITKKNNDVGEVEELYIIHHCNDEKKSASQNLNWLHFVQRFNFSKKGIKYDLVASVKDQKTLLWKNTNTSLLQDLLKYSSSSQRFNKFQGVLLQFENQIKEEIKHSNDPAFRQEHKLIRQIPSEFVKQVYKLKKHFSSEKQNLICRFLIAKQFSCEEAKASITEYITWRNDLKAKYQWEDFEEFHKMDIFTYLGQDFMGRPVILNKAKNVKVNQMDTQKYCEYYMYFFQIYLESKMRGNVCQVLIIGDSKDVGSENFKLAITKRNISDCLKYGPEKQYKLFALNAGMFVNYCWKFIKPLLPKRTHSKIQIPGEKQILNTLKQQMDISVIPSYLGGQNTNYSTF